MGTKKIKSLRAPKKEKYNLREKNVKKRKKILIDKKNTKNTKKQNKKNGVITIRGSSLRPLQLNPLIEVIKGQERSEEHLYEMRFGKGLASQKIYVC